MGAVLIDLWVVLGRLGREDEVDIRSGVQMSKNNRKLNVFEGPWRDLGVVMRRSWGCLRRSWGRFVRSWGCLSGLGGRLH